MLVFWFMRDIEIEMGYILSNQGKLYGHDLICLR